MLIEAIGLGLNEAWPLALSRPLDRAPSSFEHRHEVLPVNNDPRDPVACGMLRDVGLPMALGHRSRERVAVVLTEENDRQLPYGGHVQRLVECALVRRAITEESQ